MTIKKISYERHILALNDVELEQFVREWVGRKPEYASVERFTGAGDMGRDVVGFLTKQRHEGAWHNYQCKQYGRTLPTGKGLLELGKVLYYSWRGEFSAPTEFVYVAPRGVNRNLKRYIANPSELKSALLDQWDENCRNEITEIGPVELTPELRTYIGFWDFTGVKSVSVDEILLCPASKPVMQSWFGVDPGPAPVGSAPTNIEDRELPYVRQLLDAYSEREGSEVAIDIAGSHEVHGSHFHMQRERFFDAESFARFYRDNTMQQDIEHFRRDIRHGIAETLRAKHDDALEKIDAVMTQAANLKASGALAHHARVPVKQGICHHFANEGEIKWSTK